MKSVNLLVGVFFLSMLSIMSVFAQSGLPSSIPEGGDLSSLISLFMNYKTLGPVGIGAAAVLALIQLFKSNLFGSFFKNLSPAVKRLVITVLGQVYGILYSIASGKTVGDAILTGLIVSGGAVLIWEAVSPLFKKA